VRSELVDAFRAEIAADWRRGHDGLTVELNDGSNRFPRMAPQYEHIPHKVLDYHSVSALARDIQFVPAVRRFLGQLFERPPMAFQSLLFKHGTEQDMHQDTAYVVVRSPMQFVGCWVALEDVVPGSGELQYHGGSHRIPEFLWLGRGRACPPGFGDHRTFLDWVRAESERMGCPLIRFQPKKGDVLLWHADLVHGGSKRELPDLTRWSLVTHYCPVDVDPEWMARVAHGGRREHAPGCHYCFPQRGDEGTS
jgi:phytanoyl-CoA hydroxylase